MIHGPCLLYLFYSVRREILRGREGPVRPSFPPGSVWGRLTLSLPPRDYHGEWPSFPSLICDREIGAKRSRKGTTKQILSTNQWPVTDMTETERREQPKHKRTEVIEGGPYRWGSWDGDPYEGKGVPSLVSDIRRASPPVQVPVRNRDWGFWGRWLVSGECRHQYKTVQDTDGKASAGEDRIARTEGSCERIPQQSENHNQESYLNETVFYKLRSFNLFKVYLLYINFIHTLLVQLQWAHEVSPK